MAERPYYIISQVVEILKEDFPDITISKVRYLDRIGLLNPDRSDSGYRRFSQSDIDQLTWILTQQENFLPLKVIRERLDSGDWERRNGAAGMDSEQVAESDTVASELAPPREFLAQNTIVDDFIPSEKLHSATKFNLKSKPSSDPKHFDLAEFLEASNLTDTQLRKFEEHKLFDRKSRKQGYTEHDLKVAHFATQMLQLGLEPRHLRSYLTAAEREVDVAQQLVRSQLASKDPKKRRQGLQAMTDIVELGAQLHQTLQDRIISRQS